MRSDAVYFVIRPLEFSEAHLQQRDDQTKICQTIINPDEAILPQLSTYSQPLGSTTMNPKQILPLVVIHVTRRSLQGRVSWELGWLAQQILRVLSC